MKTILRTWVWINAKGVAVCNEFIVWFHYLIVRNILSLTLHTRTWQARYSPVEDQVETAQAGCRIRELTSKMKDFIHFICTKITTTRTRIYWFYSKGNTVRNMGIYAGFWFTNSQQNRWISNHWILSPIYKEMKQLETRRSIWRLTDKVRIYRKMGFGQLITGMLCITFFFLCWLIIVFSDIFYRTSEARLGQTISTDRRICKWKCRDIKAKVCM